MTDLRKAAEQALEALDFLPWQASPTAIIEATQALRQALEQEQKKEWVGLTDDEIYYFVRNAESYLECAKGIEAKLKEKNHGAI